MDLKPGLVAFSSRVMRDTILTHHLTNPGAERRAGDIVFDPAKGGREWHYHVVRTKAEAETLCERLQFAVVEFPMTMPKDVVDYLTSQVKP